MKKIFKSTRENKITYTILSIALLCITACTPSSHKKEGDKENQSYTRYAQGFTVNKTEDYTEISVLNPWAPGKVLQRYILVEKNKNLPENLPEGTLIRTPLNRVVSYSSIQCSMLSEIGQIQTVSGVCESEYIDIPFIREGVRNGTIPDIGLASNPDIEKILMIQPEAIFSSPLKDTGYGRIQKTGIPMIECVDYMEPTPLGRAEWIRFHALFYGEEQRADSLFHSTVVSYNQLKELAHSAKSRPSVFTETRYGNVWHMPGGRSYVAHLLKDAGAAYCWEKDTTSGSIPLSFETVLDKAGNADFWLIKYFREQEMSYDGLAAEYQPYIYFDAFKKKNIYTCNTQKVSYYEDLPIHPEYILKDLIRIFHPELLQEYSFRYYKKMEE